MVSVHPHQEHDVIVQAQTSQILLGYHVRKKPDRVVDICKSERLIVSLYFPFFLSNKLAETPFVALISPSLSLYGLTFRVILVCKNRLKLSWIGSDWMDGVRVRWLFNSTDFGMDLQLDFGFAVLLEGEPPLITASFHQLATTCWRKAPLQHDAASPFHCLPGTHWTQKFQILSRPITTVSLIPSAMSLSLHCGACLVIVSNKHLGSSENSWVYKLTQYELNRPVMGLFNKVACTGFHLEASVAVFLQLEHYPEVKHLPGRHLCFLTNWDLVFFIILNSVGETFLL